MIEGYFENFFGVRGAEKIFKAALYHDFKSVLDTTNMLTMGKEPIF